MSHKQSALAFLQLAATGHAQEAYDKFIAPDFIHHNAYFKGDRASLLAAMLEAHQKSPNKSIEVKQVLEDGDKVMTHSRVVRENPQESDVSVVHIFRFEGGKVVELWDIGQLLEKNSPNEHGAF